MKQALTVVFTTLQSVIMGASARGILCCLSDCSLSVWSCIADCLECWREVCTSGRESILMVVLKMTVATVYKDLPVW